MKRDSRGLRWLTAAALVAAAAAAVLPTALIAQSVPEVPGTARWTFDVTIDESNPVLACPPGIADPLSPERLLARPAMWASTTVEHARLDGGGSIVTPGPVAADGPVPLVLSTAGLTEGEGRSLLVAGCAAPMRHLALVGGSTVIGEDSLLTITNPGSQPTHVTVEGFGAGGPLGQLPQPLTIPARSTMTWMPATWFPEVDRLALVISADSGGIAAWMQSSGRDGEVPLGMAQLVARPPADQSMFPGVSEAAGTPVLRVVNPSEQELPIRVGTTSDRGIVPLPGTEDLRIAPGAVFEISLKGIGTDPTTVVVSAPTAFSASVVYQLEGMADPLVKDRNVEARTMVSAASVFTRVGIPREEDMRDFATTQGFTDVEVTLTVANPGDSSVMVGGQAIPPGGSRTWSGEEIDQLDGTLVADGDVYGALSVRALTDLGPVLAITDLGAAGMDTGTATVEVGP